MSLLCTTPGCRCGLATLQGAVGDTRPTAYVGGMPVRHRVLLGTITGLLLHISCNTTSKPAANDPRYAPSTYA